MTIVLSRNVRKRTKRSCREGPRVEPPRVGGGVLRRFRGVRTAAQDQRSPAHAVSHDYRWQAQPGLWVTHR